MASLRLPLLGLTLSALTLATACNNPPAARDAATLSSSETKEWLDLFNGSDLSDWAIKIKGQPLGENLHDTFRVEDGLLKVRYDQYSDFDSQFGHVFYDHQEFAYYRLQVEYRFVGEQASGGPAWALRNNGMMYHAQPASTMELDQDFPLSLEYQLLGGDGETPRTTANLCTPGTHVVIDGELRTDHCINSSSKTYHGDQWVTVELEVHGGELAQHRVNGELVMEYAGLQNDDGTPRDRGYIALQAESHPTDFRKVRLLNLEGCMDEKAKNYKSYLVKHQPDACKF